MIMTLMNENRIFFFFSSGSKKNRDVSEKVEIGIFFPLLFFISISLEHFFFFFFFFPRLTFTFIQSSPENDDTISHRIYPVYFPFYFRFYGLLIYIFSFIFGQEKHRLSLFKKSADRNSAAIVPAARR